MDWQGSSPDESSLRLFSLKRGGGVPGNRGSFAVESHAVPALLLF
jgi:hypothetical protein